ncbi:Mitochondrial phosphate carrier protein [Venturia inaequalis]|nr:Mitochondrial phosphate carrier protein [Venturia inaequalis]
MSVSVVNSDGTWSATPAGEFDFKFSNKDGDSTFDLKREISGDIEGNVTVGGAEIGTKDNHLILGGVSQNAKWDGTLKYGKTTVNVLGGSFELGDGYTDAFQISFTAEPTPKGYQVTGVATNDLVETRKIDVKDIASTTKKPWHPLSLEKKHPWFDDAGVLRPRTYFALWVHSLKLSIDLEASIDGQVATVKVTRSLKLEIRPVFLDRPSDEVSPPTWSPSKNWPKDPPTDGIKEPGERPDPSRAEPPEGHGPGNTGPDHQPPPGHPPPSNPQPGSSLPERKEPRPAPPPMTDPSKIRIHDILHKQTELQIILQFVGDCIKEVDAWIKKRDFEYKVYTAKIAVASATAAVVAAVAGAAVFFGANPLADAAVPAAELFLAAKTAELTVLETALLVAAAGAAALGAAQITYTIIVGKAPASISALARAAMPGDGLEAAAIDAGAQTYFKDLSGAYGLDAAGEDLDRLADSLKKMHDDISSELERTVKELQTATGIS